ELRDPSDAGNGGLVPFLEIDAGAEGKRGARMRYLGHALVQPVDEETRLRLLSRQRTEHDDHVEDLGESALVEGMDIDARLHKIVHDLRLNIGKGENEIGLEREDLRNVRGDEGRDARLLPPRPWRADRIAGNTGDA